MTDTEKAIEGILERLTQIEDKLSRLEARLEREIEVERVFEDGQGY